jgi:hypothetical protein
MGAEDITKPDTSQTPTRTMKGREFTGSSIQAVSTSRFLCLALQKLARVNLQMISTRLANRPSMPSGEFPIRSKAPNRRPRGDAAARANPTSIVSTTPVGASKAGVGGNSRHDPTTSPASQLSGAANRTCGAARKVPADHGASSRRRRRTLQQDARSIFSGTPITCQPLKGSTILTNSRSARSSRSWAPG